MKQINFVSEKLISVQCKIITKLSFRKASLWVHRFGRLALCLYSWGPLPWSCFVVNSNRTESWRMWVDLLPFWIARALVFLWQVSTMASQEFLPSSFRLILQQTDPTKSCFLVSSYVVFADLSPCYRRLIPRICKMKASHCTCIFT